MTRLLLAEDHILVRQSIRAFFEAEAFEVVGEAGDGLEAVRLAAHHLPDLVIMDIHMPGMNGIEATRRIRQAHPSIRVIALTAYDDEVYQRALMEAGVDAFVLKTVAFAELLAVIRAILPTSTESDPPKNTAFHLTERELEVLKAAAQGWTNKQIGVRLHISDRTVQVHLQAIYHKLGASNRTEAVSRGIATGLIKPKEQA